MRRTGSLLLALLVGLALAPSPAHAAVPVVVVEGRGHGHGVGMAQDGAYWMGADGASMDQILDHFYPGTTRGSVKMAVRVVVLVAPDGRIVLELPDGGEVRSPRSGPQHAGFPIAVGRGGSVTVTFDGAYHVEPSGGVSAQAAGEAQPVQLPTTSTTSTSSTSTTSTTSLLPIQPPSTTTTTAPPSPGQRTTTTTTTPGDARQVVSSPEPVWAGPVSAGGTIAVPARSLRYRGEMEVSAATGPLRAINEIDIEQYLWGLGEVSASWSQESLRAQIVAARTYAARAMTANHEICDTQRCQVYKGASGEFGGQVDAVNATLGTVLGYNGHFASAVFSANGGGTSATPEEGFGTSNESHPYLVAAPYETRSDVRYEVRIGLTDLARRLGYAGTATSFRVATKGPSGRPLEAELVGDRGAMRVRALEVDRAMGLKSTLWDARIVLADEAPPAPEAASLIQAPPDDVGRVIAEDQAIALREGTRFDAADAETSRTPSAPESPNGSSGDHGAVPWLLAAAVVLAGAYGAVVLRRAERQEVLTTAE